MRIVGSDAGGIHAAAEALRADDLVVLPTDTVYGLAVRADRPGAAEALATAKGRPKRQAIAVLVAGMDQARSLALVDERFEAPVPEHRVGKRLPQARHDAIEVLLHGEVIASVVEERDVA